MVVVTLYVQAHIRVARVAVARPHVDHTLVVWRHRESSVDADCPHVATRHIVDDIPIDFSYLSFEGRHPTRWR
jgi:hypothetical protein